MYLRNPEAMSPAAESIILALLVASAVLRNAPINNTLIISPNKCNNNTHAVNWKKFSVKGCKPVTLK